MDKYVYCHESNEYDDYTSLKRADYKIFTTLRTTTGAGTFIYAPTTSDKAILFSYTQSNGQSRVDGYKGEYNEIAPNPATHIGCVKVGKPYHEQVFGSLPTGRIFESSGINDDCMVQLASYVIFGAPDREIVLTGSDISRRAPEYLKFLFLLFSPDYARKVGFCINKYLKRDLDDENKFSRADEKPIIRIYALDSQKEYAGSYKINLDTPERVANDGDVGVKALIELIKRGISKENFDAIYSETEGAFLPDGRLDVNKYVRCLVRAAYQNAYDLSYTGALMEYGFSNEHEKRLFVDCIARALKFGDENQKRLTAGKAIECLGENLGSVEGPLMEYLVSKPSLTIKEHQFLVRSALNQLGDGSRRNADDDNTLGLYLQAPSPSWKQKYAFITEIIQGLIGGGKPVSANKVCKVLAERFNRENLAYANSISIEDLFALSSGIGSEARDAIYASLLKNDCGAGKIHYYARHYLKGNPSLAEILRVRRKMQEIFDANDFIFGDIECARIVRERIAQSGIVELLAIYDELSSQMSDYLALKAELYFGACDLQKLKIADRSIMERYKSFLFDVEAELSAVGNVIGKAKENALAESVEECKTYVIEKASADIAQKNIEAFQDEFAEKLYDMLSQDDKKEVDEAAKGESARDGRGEEQTERRQDKAAKYTKINSKYSEANNVGMYFNGTHGYGYSVALGLLAGIISLLIMVLPAICLSAAVGDLSFTTFKMFLSRYFYVAIIAPVFTVVLYTVLYVFSADPGRARKAFSLTALCSFIPCLLCGLGYSLSFILLT